jgi:chemotaxis response regulator CheB
MKDEAASVPLEAARLPVVVAVGSSANGVNVLTRLVAALPAAYPGVVI